VRLCSLFCGKLEQYCNIKIFILSYKKVLKTISMYVRHYKLDLRFQKRILNVLVETKK